MKSRGKSLLKKHTSWKVAAKSFMLLLCDLGGLAKKNIPRQLLFSRKAYRLFTQSRWGYWAAEMMRVRGWDRWEAFGLMRREQRVVRQWGQPPTCLLLYNIYHPCATESLRLSLSGVKCYFSFCSGKGLSGELNRKSTRSARSAWEYIPAELSISMLITLIPQICSAFMHYIIVSE